MGLFMYRVLAFTLVRMPAYEKLWLEFPSDGLWPDWEGLRKWLMVELPAEMLAQWDAHWAAPMEESKATGVTRACGRIEALFAELNGDALRFQALYYNERKHLEHLDLQRRAAYGEVLAQPAA